MSTEIKITGQPTANPMVCKFIVDQNVLPAPFSILIDKKEKGLGSRLIEELMGLPEIVSVYISGSVLSITKSDSSAWPVIGKKIGQAIRASLTSEEGPFSKNLLEKLAASGSPELIEKVLRVFKEEINPAIAAHGGFVELVRVLDRDVYLKMGGGCQGCASSLLTLKQGIETSLKNAIPEIENVVDDTDHDAGTNPYMK